MGTAERREAPDDGGAAARSTVRESPRASDRDIPAVRSEAFRGAGEKAASVIDEAGEEEEFEEVPERIAYRPLRGAPRLIPLISAIGVSFFLQDLIRFIESLWRSAFNLVYPTMDVLNHRFEITETNDISVKSIVVIVAALNLVLDFDFIENGVEKGAPKFMEWYAAFGLLVTLVWLYLEILRLLSKLQSRN